jgi:hypothetical protein
MKSRKYNADSSAAAQGMNPVSAYALFQWTKHKAQFPLLDKPKAQFNLLLTKQAHQMLKQHSDVCAVRCMQQTQSLSKTHHQIRHHMNILAACSHQW